MYYDRLSNKAPAWYVWVIVLWAMLVTWMLGQLALTSPFEPMLEAIDPETAERANQLMYDALTEDPVTALRLLIGIVLAGIGALLGFTALMVHYFGKRGKASLVTGLIGVFMTLIGLVPIFMANGALAEGSTLLMSVIGLSPVAYMLMLLTFPAALVGLYAGWKYLHLRPITALHTAWSHFRWKRVAQSFFIMWLVLGAYGLIMVALGKNPPTLVFDASRFLPFAIVSILLLPVQSATEEIVVRGYMNKGLVQLLGNKWVVFVLTSGLFAALHLANPEAQAGADSGNLIIVMSGYFFFGFAACLMVLIDDGLESAIGVHAANNTFAAIFINYENSVLPTPSIWQVKAEPTTDSITIILVLSVVLALLWVTRPKSRYLKSE